MKLPPDVREALGDVVKTLVAFAVSLTISAGVLALMVFAYRVRSAFGWP